MPTCTAFKRDGRPCTAAGRERDGGVCGRHRITDPGLRAQFDHDQAIYREAWEGIALGTHQYNEQRKRVERIVVVRERVPVVHPVCNALKKNGLPCTVNATHADGKCGLHHGLAVRRDEDAPRRGILREMRRMYRTLATVAQIDNYVREQTAPLAVRVRLGIMWDLDHMILRPFYELIDINVHQHRATEEQIDAILEGWMAAGQINARRQDLLRVRAAAAIGRRHWNDRRPPQQQFLPGQREAQLAHDGQNVHTPEISKQLKDSLEILTKVEVPVDQTTTMEEIVTGWRAAGYPADVIERVRHDMVTWWNKTEIYHAGDKLYKKALRGLWWTIKSYKGELRAELEKRLWDECKDAALPYSVCTQGHLARLSNVMVGFDDAFVPPVPVGEILQQKMAAISEMEVPYEKQIELAEAVLVELNIPAEEHKNWLAAF